MDRDFVTVKEMAMVLYEEKKSKFYAYVFPVENEEDVFVLLNKIQNQYKDATHMVYAYDISQGIRTQRFTDDGEPSGTAGLPILELLNQRDVRNVLIVVFRYFGGTLLGANGLTRAYRKSATHVLSKACLVCKELCQLFRCEMSYAQSDSFQYYLKQQHFKVLSVQYSQHVSFEILVPISKTEHFRKEISEWGNCEYSIHEGECFYATLNE